MPDQGTTEKASRSLGGNDFGRYTTGLPEARPGGHWHRNTRSCPRTTARSTARTTASALPAPKPARPNAASSAC